MLTLLACLLCSFCNVDIRSVDYIKAYFSPQLDCLPASPRVLCRLVGSCIPRSLFLSLIRLFHPLTLKAATRALHSWWRSASLASGPLLELSHIAGIQEIIRLHARPAARRPTARTRHTVRQGTLITRLRSMSDTLCARLPTTLIWDKSAITSSQDTVQLK